MPIIIMVYKYMYVHVTSDPVCYLLMVSTLKLCTFGYSVENTLLIEWSFDSPELRTYMCVILLV